MVLGGNEPIDQLAVTGNGWDIKTLYCS